MINSTLNSLKNNNRLPIIVGGSGQYMMALLENWLLPRVEPDEKFRKELELIAQEKGKEFLHKQLEDEYPFIAENIDKNNTRRVIRGFELARAGVARIENNRGEEFSRFQVYGLTMSREQLYERIDKRIERMFERGWVKEVECLISRGVNRDSPSFRNIGYQDIYSFINQEMIFDELVSRIKRSTRNLIRHQYNWFKLSDKRIKWIDISGRKNINYAFRKIIEDLK